MDGPHVGGYHGSSHGGPVGRPVAFYGLLEYLSGSHGIFGWENPDYTGRLTGTFANPDHFAAWLAMLIPLALRIWRIFSRQALIPSTSTSFSVR